METMIFRAEALSAGYDGVPVVRDVEIALRPGEILTLIGPNGAGKSTLLKTIIRQLEPLGGTVFFGDRASNSVSDGELSRFLSIVMTERVDGEWMTAEDVVSTGRYPYTGRLGVLSPADREKVEEAMDLTRVTELRERDFRRLSDGQRQRVLLARAVCQEPRVLVMDEPTSFLDIRYQLELLDLLKRLTEEKGLAVILSLHELELARRISDRVLCLRAGRIDRAGPPAEVMTGPYLEALYELPEGSLENLFGPLPAEEKGPHHAFFQNRRCESFPCHKDVPEAEFNCLFCYCPLYALGESCGGGFTYTETGRKNCAGCGFPHLRSNYGAVLKRYPELAALAGKKE